MALDSHFEDFHGGCLKWQQIVVLASKNSVLSTCSIEKTKEIACEHTQQYLSTVYNVLCLPTIRADANLFPQYHS
jgi:hypothetical protein